MSMYSLLYGCVPSDYVFGLYPAQLVFTITITIEKVSYTRKNGEQVTEKLDTLVLSPFQRIKSSKDTSVSA